MTVSKTGRAFALILWLVSLTGVCSRAAAVEPALKILAKPLHSGRISPMLFGNFIELLDDLVPGMWAEMLNDRGFEGVIPPEKWVYYDGAPTFCDRSWNPSADWNLESAGAFNGPRSARIGGRGTHPAGLSQSGLFVKHGARYRFSGYLRSDGSPLRVQLLLKALLPDGRFAELAAADLPAPSTTWTKCTAELEPHGTSDRTVFELRVIGTGTLWADKFSLMPLENRLGWRSDVVAAIKAVRPALIRWGGSAVDPGQYRWKNGIGDHDRRVPFPNSNWGRIDSNDVGIDEFCQFCTLVDARPLVCVSFSDGAPNAADLVQYCNGGADTKWGSRRAANGHAAPYAVKYWQLGNEISGNDEAYIKKCRDFIRAMKAADPAIAVVSSFPSQRVLDVLGRDLAYLAPHHYTRGLAACEADFDNLSRMIARTPGCGHLRLAVTEWNFTAGDWGLGRGKMLTLEGAILNAKYLNLLCRHCNLVEIACRSNMTNSFCSGIIGTNPAGVLKRPSYHVMKLYADHVLPIPLLVGHTPAGLDAIACGDESRHKIVVFVVNGGGKPVKFSLDLGEFSGDAAPQFVETVCDALDMRQADVMNHWSRPNRVRTIGTKVSGSDLTLPALSVSAIVCGSTRHGN
jgi:alpha-L-arabinofuranosidase